MNVIGKMKLKKKKMMMMNHECSVFDRRLLPIAVEVTHPPLWNEVGVEQ